MRAASGLPRAMPPALLARAMSQATLLFASVLAAGALSVFALGQDANWDLQNYHFYNAWAFVHQRLAWDIAPAQLQTFHNPLIELPFFWMVNADWPPRLISFVMGLPAGVGVFFLGKTLHVLFGNLATKERWFYATVAFVVGITGSASVSQLGATVNEWQGAALTLIALWLVVARSARGTLSWPTVVVAGLLCGVADGLKLTTATYAVGLCCALLLQRPIFRVGLGHALAFGFAVLAGVAVAAGPWMWTLYSHFANPLFPYFNDVFHSPWWDPKPLLVRNFGPHTLLEWLTFPLPLFGYSTSYVTELRFRDWRLPLLYVFALAALVAWSIRRIGGRDAVAPSPGARPAWRLLGVFWCVSFVLWAGIHSIYRYVIPLELLSGALLVYLLLSLVPPHPMPGATIALAARATIRYPGWLHRQFSQHRLKLNISPPRWSVAVTLVISALAVFTVRYPDWWHVAYGEHYFEVDVPPVAPHAAVVLVTPAPMAYVLPFFPPDGRFLGAYNNLNDPTRTNLLEHELARVIREHDGPLYSLAFPAGAGSEILAAHALRPAAKGSEADCTSFKTNMSTSPLQLCRLQRVDPETAAARPR